MTSWFVPAAAGFGLLTALVSGAAAETLVERGDYLVNTVMACGNCHTPIGPGGPDMERALSGGLTFDEPPFTVTASNITPDEATGIGAWSDADIKTALVGGIRPDGTPLAPVMPYAFYKVLSPRDLDAIVAYLRSLPAVENQVPTPDYRQIIVAKPFPGADEPIPEAARAGNIETEGFYLTTIAHCMECHTRWTDGHPDPVAGLGAGGREFPGPWGVAVAANITPDPEAGIGAWSDEEIKRAIAEGVRPDGTPLKPPMGYPYYHGMTDADLTAVVAYLRTIPTRQ
ncbi:cytochrome c4 [Amorphus orientalis]|uniref:Mono/diheme cytochrome c family protein n=1 Tax=Amorphus orientalis TaxID=649198 RepID=A0AAE4ATY8_9HYPH|nr:cytochrome c [Amorphus orientalis]MDQ0316755.1 mono/diheme cytochrome c family protein [Amorphus orientalis]